MNIKIVITRIIPDRIYIQMQFLKHFGRFANLKTPTTFSEKIQWLKLYDRKPIYTTLVDKYEVKKYVANIIGEEHIIPTLGVWDDPKDINFDTLPNQFVLKWNHDSGSVIICRDKSCFDRLAAVEKLTRYRNHNGYWYGREWPYKNVIPRIIAEQYMEDDRTHDLKDYKLFAFDGITKALFIASDRHTDGVETKFDFFDTDFKPLLFTNGHPNSEVLPARPVTFDKMKEFANKLSAGIPALRVDFYEVNGTLYFGEFTFSHWSGFMPFNPEEWDKTFGSWIRLPEKSGR